MDREKNWQITRRENFRQMDLFQDELLAKGSA